MLEGPAEQRVYHDRVVRRPGEELAGAVFNSADVILHLRAGGDARALPLPKGLTRIVILQRDRDSARAGAGIVKPQKGLRRDLL